jgi:hypothetical protein
MNTIIITIFLLFTFVQEQLAYKHTYSVDISTDRLQWNNNSGYCGEVSTITAGLFYGQYLSQFDTREIAAKNYTPTFDENPQTAQLLLGESDVYTADKLKLKSAKWDTSINDTKLFLQWVKQQTILGFPVTIGVLDNQNFFAGNKKGGGLGNPEYDHIVSVVSVSSNHNDNKYHDDDLITFADHGLVGTMTFLILFCLTTRSNLFNDQELMRMMPLALPTACAMMINMVCTKLLHPF